MRAPASQPAPALPADAWSVREALPADAAAVAVGVQALVRELGGTPAALASMEVAARAVIADDRLGCVIVGEAADTLVGLLAVSWQTAVHAGGRYGLIQDLWVSPRFRDGLLGSALLKALFAHATASGIARIEVGLPTPRFTGLTRTESFYLRNGFTPVGPRMRRSIA